MNTSDFFRENSKDEIRELANDAIAGLGCIIDENNLCEVREAIRVLNILREICKTD